MRFFSNETHFDFLGWRFISLSASWAIILAGVVAYFVMGGFNYGIDFTGGTLVQVKLPNAGDIKAIRQTLSNGGIQGFALQSFGNPGADEYLVSLAKADEGTSVTGKTPAAQVEEVLKAHYPDMDVRRVESVGPKVGTELKDSAYESIVFSLIALLIYIWIRFEWRYSIGAIVATAHDVLIVLAAFVFTQREVSLTVVAAVLTVAGYSVNDTIVIFDRIREYTRKFRKRDVKDTFNDSINHTLSRTVLTSGTTLLVVLAIFLFGGQIINDFAFGMLIGVMIGTYSSIFVAAPVVYMLQQRFPPKLR
ncbi:MAG TPA: protein translocase subunit SecF [bacterium]|nr:protein translocase subunit SecF [bacterium]